MNPSARWLSTALRSTAPPPSWTPSPAISATLAPAASRATSRRTPRNAKTTTSSSWTSPPPRRPSPPPRAPRDPPPRRERACCWVTSRGTDRYVSAARSPFARDREDLWKLGGPRARCWRKILQPARDNPDDPLCLVYSCVNDPRAPPGATSCTPQTPRDEGRRTEGVEAGGLLANASDAAEKLQAWTSTRADGLIRSSGTSAWRNPAPARVRTSGPLMRPGEVVCRVQAVRRIEATTP